MTLQQAYNLGFQKAAEHYEAKMRKSAERRAVLCKAAQQAQPKFPTGGWHPTYNIMRGSGIPAYYNGGRYEPFGYLAGSVSEPDPYYWKSIGVSPRTKMLALASPTFKNWFDAHTNAVDAAHRQIDDIYGSRHRGKGYDKYSLSSLVNDELKADNMEPFAHSLYDREMHKLTNGVPSRVTGPGLGR